MDFVDPQYDFLSDENAPGRRLYWDDAYPHELLQPAPYDGVLISRSIVGDHIIPGKYTESQAMRFRRVGARKFLRLEQASNNRLPLFGDCGAFSYVNSDEPPYTPSDTVDFYEEAGFTHGFSVDHIIFEFDTTGKLPVTDNAVAIRDESKRRYEITLELAADFLGQHRRSDASFHPIGVVQGWSPASMGEAARNLVHMGYDYIALGGMAPLRAGQIRAALEAVQTAIKGASPIKVHLLGFAKADELEQFIDYRIESFDTTSPLIRAFKDGKRNYYWIGQSGRMEYYTAIRIPQVHANPTLKREISSGRYRQEDVLRREDVALTAVRDYAARRRNLEDALDPILSYLELLLAGGNASQATVKKKLDTARERYKRTLHDRPWEACKCSICANAGVETVIFRGSNRNKRRGIHNLQMFHEYLHTILKK